VLDEIFERLHAIEVNEPDEILFGRRRRRTLRGEGCAAARAVAESGHMHRGAARP
jgi:hypothetical protein